MSWSEAWGILVPLHRLCRQAVQGSLSCGAGRVPVHAPVQPAWSAVRPVMSGLRVGALRCCSTGCVVTLRRARCLAAQAECLFMPLYSQHGQLSGL